MCEDKGWERQWNPCHSKNNNSSKDLNGIKDSDKIHIVLLDFHLCCITNLNLVQNAKPMSQEAGTYMNDEANGTGDVWRWITISGSATRCNKNLSVDLQFSASPGSPGSRFISGWVWKLQPSGYCKLCEGSTLKSFPWRTDFLITCSALSRKHKIWEEGSVPTLKSMPPDVRKLWSTQTISCGCLYGPRWIFSWSLSDFISSMVWCLGPRGGRCWTPWIEPQNQEQTLVVST